MSAEPLTVPPPTSPTRKQPSYCRRKLFVALLSVGLFTGGIIVGYIFHQPAVAVQSDGLCPQDSNHDTCVARIVQEKLDFVISHYTTDSHSDVDAHGDAPFITYIGHNTDHQPLYCMASAAIHKGVLFIGSTDTCIVQKLGSA